MNYISPEKYSTLSNTHLATVYRMLERGELKTHFEGAKKMVVISEKKYTEYEKLENQLELKKSKWNNLLLKANRKPEEKDEIIKTICAEVLEMQKKGAKIIGFSKAACYKKAAKGKVTREPHGAKGKIFNSVLKQPGKLDKLFDLCKSMFTKGARKNLTLCIDKIIMRAEQDEEYWEFAAVSPHTMWKIMNREFDKAGVKNLHEYLNHRNLVHQKRPFVPGAFQNIPFMAYIIGDDHKFDVASVTVYDDVKKKFVSKQVKIWLWMEAKTMYPLGWSIQVQDFKGQDLINSLSHVFHRYGLPQNAVMLDNGVGRAERVIDFISKCNSDVDDLQGFAAKYDPWSSDSPVEFSEAYTPTNKSPVERTFKLYKEEHDTDFENFVGPDKMNESRHTGLSMSPEKSEMMFEQFRKHFENYLTGFFLKRKRTRVVEGKKMKISIQDYWNHCMANYEKKEIELKTIRFAHQHSEVKEFSTRFVFKGNQYIPEPGVILPLSFYNRKYTVFYNPDNLNEIDFYAIDDMEDKYSEMKILRGEHVCTLCSLTADDPEVRKKVMGYKKQIQKMYKSAAEVHHANDELMKGEVDKFSVDKFTDGTYLAERREAIKAIEQTLINAKPLPKVNAAYLAEGKEERIDETKIEAPLHQSGKVNDDEDFELTYD